MTMSNSSNSTPRLTVKNGSISPNDHPSTATTATIPTGHSTIDDFREIVREQSFVIPNNSDHESLDVPVKKYPPLPDITVPNSALMDNTFFRTETILIPPKQIESKKQVFNHFAPTQRGHLPALNKCHMLPTMSNVMDLDEDLPQCNTNTTYRAATYTSPGDRIISPIKRPSAPSPPPSAPRKRPGQNAFCDDDDDDDDDDEGQNEEPYSGVDVEDSQLFDEEYCCYHQPTIMNHCRVNHYSSNNRHSQNVRRQPAIVISDEYDKSVDPLDSNNFKQ